MMRFGFASVAVVLIAGVVAGANLVALLGMALIVQPAGALVLVIAVSAFGQLLRPLRTIVRIVGQTSAGEVPSGAIAI